MVTRAGVLGLQGSSEPHLERLAELGLSPVEVRQKRHLTGLTHLILPGGESTTIRHLLDLFGLTPELVSRHRAGEVCLFGTCAGAILLARDDGERPPRLALLDAEVERNAYGRQIDSFTREVNLALGTREVNLALGTRDAGLALGEAGTAGEAGETDASPFHCVFIRAPRFKSVGAAVKVLGEIEGEPILVSSPGLLAGTFHPELTGDLRVHRHFLAMEPAARSATIAV